MLGEKWPVGFNFAACPASKKGKPGAIGLTDEGKSEERSVWKVG